MTAPGRPAISALGRMLAPGSVAVVGASPREGALSRRFVSGLARHGFPGPVVPVNPKYEQVDGVACVPSLADAGEVDVAVLAVPKRLVLESLEQCAEAGVAGAVVFASGYSETGAPGVAAEIEIAQLARRTGLRVLGPNSPGFVNVSARCCVIASGISFRQHFDAGPVAVVSQSGGVGGLLAERAQDRGIGLSLLVCSGNEADVGIGELLELLAREEPTRAVAVFLEGARDGSALTAGLDALRAAGKAAVVLSPAGTEAAVRASQAHTGALATPDSVLDAVLARHGAVRARGVDELIDTAATLAHLGPVPTRAVGIVTTSGGGGVIAAEAAERAGLELPPPSERACEALAAVVPEFASAANPADMSGMFVEDPEIFRGSLAAFLACNDYGAVVLVLTVHPPALAEELAERTTAVAAGSRTPLVVLWTAGAMSEPARRRLRESHVLVLEDAERCMRALAARAMTGLLRAEPMPHPEPRVPAVLEAAVAAGSSLEYEALAALAEAEVTVAETRFCRSSEEAAAAAVAVGGPLAVKAAARDLPHKEAAGAVALGVEGAEAAAGAFERVVRAARAAEASVEGAVVQRLAGPGVEAIVGVRRDRSFGPVLVAGLGGAAAEALGDVARRMLPLRAGEAHELLGELRAAALLAGCDVGALASAIERIASLALQLGDRLEALEVNPLIVHAAGATAVDALALFTTEENR